MLGVREQHRGIIFYELPGQSQIKICIARAPEGAEQPGSCSYAGIQLPHSPGFERDILLLSQSIIILPLLAPEHAPKQDANRVATCALAATPTQLPELQLVQESERNGVGGEQTSSVNGASASLPADAARARHPHGRCGKHQAPKHFLEPKQRSRSVFARIDRETALSFLFSFVILWVKRGKENGIFNLIAPF